MALAVKSSPESTTRRSFHHLGLDSLVGMVYVLASMGIVFYLLPTAWHWLGLTTDSPILYALLALVMLVVATGLAIGGFKLVGPNPPHGLRAGIVVACVGVLIICLITSGVGSLIERGFGLQRPVLGVAVTIVVFVALLAFLGSMFLRGRVDRWLIQLEDQGWFTMQPYKRSQGQKVRRGTILGILVLAGCGIWTLLSHRTLGTGGSWRIPIPFAAGQYLTLLPQVQFTVPILLALLSLWVAYRVVNFPGFADFLIATEAEMNKVSWSTRPRLINDTIVVLIATLLLTIFLFVVDVAWSQLLSRIGIIQMDSNTAKEIDKPHW